jgi:hypothetical protein
MGETTSSHVVRGVTGPVLAVVTVRGFGAAKGRSPSPLTGWFRRLVGAPVCIQAYRGQLLRGT